MCTLSKNLFFILLYIASGCSNWTPSVDSKTSAAEGLDELRAKRDLYLKLGQDVYAPLKFMHSRCDGLLFTALWQVSGGNADMTVFESKSEPGRWYRNPEQDCFLPNAAADKRDNGSKTTISKDMYIGLLHFLVANKNPAPAKRALKYAVQNNWKVGQGIDPITELSTVYLTPQIYLLLRDLVAKLENQKPDFKDHLAEDDSARRLANTGFQAHLDVLYVLLSGKVYGQISPYQLNLLKTQAEREPNNALYQAAYHLYHDGQQSVATDLLLDANRFPAEQLPNNHDQHCTEYLYQRDEVKNGSTSNDWLPCPDETKSTHSGTDFTFAAHIILDSQFTEGTASSPKLPGAMPTVRDRVK